MEFKVGEKVNNFRYGRGIIESVEKYSSQPYLVRYDTYHSELHGGSRGEDGHYWYYREDEIEKFIVKETEKGEKIMINYEDILRIYKKRKREEYEEARKTKKENYEDAYTKLKDEYNKKLLEQLKKDNKESSYGSYKLTYAVETEERIKENGKIDEEYYERINKLDKLVDEVKAQLQLCTTREETLEVLKLYKIVDKSGKIYGCEE